MAFEAIRNRGSSTRRARRSRRMWRRATPEREQAAASRRFRFRAARGIVGKVIVVLLAFAVCILPIPLVNNIIGYIPLLTLALVIIVSFVYLQLLVRALSFSEDSLAPSCERGSEIEFVILFKNSSPLVFVRLEPHIFIGDMFGGESSTFTSSMVLGPHETRDFRFGATFDHIGRYAAGLDRVVISDLFGLFTHTVVNESRHHVEVMPRLFDVSRVGLTNVSVMETQRSFQPIVTDDMDYAGVREYQWGDPLKTIHWKLSARGTGSDYYTRLFEAFTNPSLSIVLDATADAYDSETLMFMFDGLVESALSLNDFAIQQGVDPEILFFDNQDEELTARIRSAAEFEVLVHNVPRIRIDEGRAALGRLRTEGSSLYGSDNIAICTTHAIEEIVSTLVEIKMRKRNPLLFLVIPRGMGAREREELLRPLRRLDGAGVVYYVVSSAEELGGGEEL